MTPDAGSVPKQQPPEIIIEDDNTKNKPPSLSDIFFNGARGAIELSMSRSDHHPRASARRSRAAAGVDSSAVGRSAVLRAATGSGGVARRNTEGSSGGGNVGLIGSSEHGSENRYRRHRSATAALSSSSTKPLDPQRRKAAGDSILEPRSPSSEKEPPTPEAPSKPTIIGSASRRRAPTTSTTSRRARSSRTSEAEPRRTKSFGDRGRSSRNSNNKGTTNQSPKHHNHSSSPSHKQEAALEPQEQQPLRCESIERKESDTIQPQPTSCESPRSPTKQRRSAGSSTERRRASRHVSSSSDGRLRTSSTSTTSTGSSTGGAPSTPDRRSSSRYSSRERSRQKRHEASPAARPPSLRRMRKGTKKPEESQEAPLEGSQLVDPKTDSPSQQKADDNNAPSQSSSPMTESPRKSPMTSAGNKRVIMDDVLPAIPQLRDQLEEIMMDGDVDDFEMPLKKEDSAESYPEDNKAEGGQYSSMNDVLLESPNKKNDPDFEKTTPGRRPRSKSEDGGTMGFIADALFFESPYLEKKKKTEPPAASNTIITPVPKIGEDENEFDAAFFSSRKTATFSPVDNDKPEATKVTHTFDESIAFTLNSPMGVGGKPFHPPFNLASQQTKNIFDDSMAFMLNSPVGDDGKEKAEAAKATHTFDESIAFTLNSPMGGGGKSFHPPFNLASQQTKSIFDDSMAFMLNSPVGDDGKASKSQSTPTSPTFGTKKEKDRENSIIHGKENVFDPPFATDLQANGARDEAAPPVTKPTGEVADEKIDQVENEFVESAMFPLNSPMATKSDRLSVFDPSSKPITPNPVQWGEQETKAEDDRLSKTATDLNTTSHGKKKRLGKLLGKFKTFNKLDDAGSVFSVDVKDPKEEPTEKTNEKPKPAPVSLAKTLGSRKIKAFDKFNDSGMLSFSMDLAVPDAKIEEIEPSPPTVARRGLFTKAASSRNFGAATKGVKQFQSFDDSGMISFSLDAALSPTKQETEETEDTQALSTEPDVKNDEDLFGQNTFGIPFATEAVSRNSHTDVRLETLTEEGLEGGEGDREPDVEELGFGRLDALLSQKTHQKISSLPDPSVCPDDFGQKGSGHKKGEEIDMFGGFGKLDTLLSQTTHNKPSSLPDPSVCPSFDGFEGDHTGKLEVLLARPGLHGDSDVAEPSVCEADSGTGDTVGKLSVLLSNPSCRKHTSLALASVAESWELDDENEQGAAERNDESLSLSVASLPGESELEYQPTKTRSRSYSDDNIGLTSMSRTSASDDDVSLFDHSVMTAQEEQQFLQLNLPGMDGYKSSSSLAVVEHTFSGSKANNLRGLSSLQFAGAFGN